MRAVSQQTRKRIAAARRRNWADPEWKRRTSAAIRAAHNDPEFRRAHDLLVTEQVEQLVAQLRAGSSIGQVARDWLVSTSTVYKYAHQHGIDLADLRARVKARRRARSNIK